MKHAALLLMLLFASSVPGLRVPTVAPAAVGAEPVWQSATSLENGPVAWLRCHIPPAASASAVRALARLLRTYAEGPATLIAAERPAAAA